MKKLGIATSYRPSTFEEVVGQEIAVSALKNVALSPGISVKSIFLKGSFGSGKCISLNSLIQTKEGWLKGSTLYERYKNKIDVDGFCEVDDLFVKQTNGTFAKCSHFYYSSESEIITVEYDGGVIKGTPEHRVLARVNGSYCIIPLGLLSIHDNIVILTKDTDLLMTDTTSSISDVVENYSVLKSITRFFKSRGPVFDVVVPDTHLFVSHGVVNHNTTLSRLFGRAVNCETFQKTGELCKKDNLCKWCQEAKAKNSQHYLEFDSTRVGSVEQIRDMDMIFSMPPSDGRRVICIDESATCHYYSSKVMCLEQDGTIKYRPIGQIVNNKLSVDVITFDGKNLCTRKVIDWHKNPKRSLHMYRFTDGSKDFHLVCTADHRVICKSSDNNSTYEVPVSMLNKHDRVILCSDFFVHGKTDTLMELSECRFVGEVEMGKEIKRKTNETSNTYDIEVEETHCYFVDHVLVHNCSRSAQNALLKVLEEGVKNTFMVFASTDPMIPTIMSRSLVLDITTIPYVDIKNRVRSIAESRGTVITEDQLDLIAMKSDGHMRNALSLLELYEIAGPESLKSSLQSLRKYLLRCLKKEDINDIVGEIMLYPMVDVKNSLSILLRDLFTSDEAFEKNVRSKGLAIKIFNYFYSPVAQQALKDEYGTEILLRSFAEMLNPTKP